MQRRIRRTTRLDVGLALTFTGLAFCVWSFVAGISRVQMQMMIRVTRDNSEKLPDLSQWIKLFFVDTGFVIDVAGLAWMMLSLVLVLLASRQKVSISWAWVSAIMQSLVAALGAVLVSTAAFAPFYGISKAGDDPSPILEKVSQISLPVVIALAICIWVLFLIWMLIERSRLSRTVPSLSDGLRSNM